jgi:pyruvate kinase
MIRKMKRTKIVATIGMASDNSEMLKKMSDAGVNIYRLNFSHGDHAEHAEKIKKIREELKLDSAILLDTKGPEIRTGRVNGKVEVKEGDVLTLTVEDVLYEDAGKLGISYKNFVNDVEVGDIVVLLSGAVLVEVVSKTATDVVTKVVSGSGKIGSKRHVNLRGKKVSLPTVTEQDWKDIDFGIEQKVDYIALSFVRTAKDIKEVREYCRNKGQDIKIISKIENYESVQNLEEIVKESDGVMVARGDLACEISFPKVPAVQRRIMDLCDQYKKTVIVATQMLMSMVDSITPTRAEVMDVSTAVYDGADAVMLSDEATKSADPSHVVKMMASIAKETEKEVYEFEVSEKEKGCSKEKSLNGISASISAMVETMECIDSIVVVSDDYDLVNSIANYRPTQTIFAFTNDQKNKNQMELVFNTYPQKMDISGDLNSVIKNALKVVKTKKADAKKCVLVSYTEVNGEKVPTIQIVKF